MSHHFPRILGLIWAALVTPAVWSFGDFPGLPRLIPGNFAPTIREQFQKAYEAVRAKPRDPDANGRLGMLYQAYEQLEHAAICYERARFLAPAQFEWGYYLGTVRAALGRHAEASVILREALVRKPDYLPARLKLAESLLVSAELDHSQRVYEDIVKEHPDSALAHYGMGKVGSRKHWLVVRLEGVRDNRNGLGALVALLRGGQKPLWRRVHSDGSYLNASDSRVHFGLGTEVGGERIEVHWHRGGKE